ncbi:hypothetical protein [Caldicellulosiruptor acetigenus]|uniref:Uncharacterized protein n=1 Tax=Caldicellulosiruptor acetigenus 6A TaxID=632516 RepID=G2PV37_9FIRM|nr:hypothetical protein [Caldicellulosiruptor acetigenus]AEM72728.1 hypothetical protein Calla_0033 [Caldicellulosiruptor acetigenus 6A]
MKEYFLYVRSVKTVIIMALIVAVVSGIFSIFLNQKLLAYCLFLFILAVLTINKCIYYYNDPITVGIATNIYSLTFLYVAPLKRIQIAVWDSLFDLTIILLNFFGFNIGLLSAKLFFPSEYSYSIIPLSISLSATTLSIFSLFCLMTAMAFFIKNRLIFTLALIMACAVELLLAIFPLYILSTSNKKVAIFTINLYNDFKSSVIILLFSIVLFAVSFLVNVIYLYRREV